MAYTAYKTWTVGEILTAANMNAQVRDNGLLGPEALATADGEIWIATGANAGEMVAAFDSSNLLKRDRGGLEVALADPDADRILFWDDGAGAYAYLTPGTDLAISGTSLNVTAAIQATQAEAEAESNVDKYLPPDLLKHLPGVAKCWVIHSADAASILASYNLASLTDTGVGNRIYVFDDDFSSADYVAVGNCGAPAGGALNGMIFGQDERLAGSIQAFSRGGSIHSSATSPGSIDHINFCAFFGDQ